MRKYTVEAFCADIIDVFENCSEPLFVNLVSSHMQKCKSALCESNRASPSAFRRKLSFSGMIDAASPQNSSIIAKIDKLLDGRGDAAQDKKLNKSALAGAFTSPREKASSSSKAAESASSEYKRAWKELREEGASMTTEWRESLDQATSTCYYWRYYRGEYESTWNPPDSGVYLKEREARTS